MLTELKVTKSRPGDKLSEPAPRGSGRLVLRVRENGTREFYFRSRAGGRDRSAKIGNHPAVSLQEARRRARELGGSAVAVEARGTLGELLGAYVADLRARGKVSAGNVEATLRRALPEGHALRRRRASQVTADQITRIIAARVRDGARVEANRLRAWLSAAFAFGAKADHDPARDAGDGVRFGIAHNPVAVVARLPEGGRLDENGDQAEPRVLSWAELAAYWRALEGEPDAVKAALRFVLAAGGQRMQQVLRAEWRDLWEVDAAYARDHGLPEGLVGLRVLHLEDTKGRGRPRRHDVPIVPLAQAQLDLLAGGGRPFPVSHFALADAISRASARVVKALKCEPFDARALRRSVETRLGDLGVGRDTRAHLLSHGRTGIQNRYDFARRLPEKRDALVTWTAALADAIAKPPAVDGAKRRRPSRKASRAKAGG